MDRATRSENIRATSSNDNEFTATMAHHAKAPVVTKAPVLMCHPGAMSMGDSRELKESGGSNLNTCLWGRMSGTVASLKRGSLHGLEAAAGVARSLYCGALGPQTTES